MKVKANEKFGQYRNQVLKLDLKIFRSLQAGKEVELSEAKIKEYPHIYDVGKVKEVKDGD